MSARAKYTLSVILLFTTVCILNIFIIEKDTTQQSVIRNIILASALCAAILLFGRRKIKQ